MPVMHMNGCVHGCMHKKFRGNKPFPAHGSGFNELCSIIDSLSQFQ